jgi:hypothetical protein
LDKHWQAYYSWFLFILTVLQATQLILFILSGYFSWELIFRFVIGIGLVIILWLILAFLTLRPYQTAIIILAVIFTILLYASPRDPTTFFIYDFLESRFHIEYFVGMVDILALTIAVMSIYEQQKERDKENKRIRTDYKTKGGKTIYLPDNLNKTLTQRTIETIQRKNNTKNSIDNRKKL